MAKKADKLSTIHETLNVDTLVVKRISEYQKELKKLQDAHLPTLDIQRVLIGKISELKWVQRNLKKCL